MSDNYVSIILPTYNRMGVLDKAINSVLEQTYTKFELIIVDDGSTDGTEEYVKGIDDTRVQYIRGNHKGAAAARNLGLQNAQYKYIAFQDSDDLWVKTKLEKQMKILTEADDEVALVYCRYEYHPLQGNQSMNWPPDGMPEEMCSGNMLRQLLKQNLIGTPTMLLRKNVIEKVGSFYEDLPALEDYEFALRVARQYKIGYVKEPLLQVYESKDSISNDNEAFFVVMCYLIKCYRKELLEFELFNEVVASLLKKAELLGAVEPVSRMLERMLTS